MLSRRRRRRSSAPELDKLTQLRDAYVHNYTANVVLDRQHALLKFLVLCKQVSPGDSAAALDAVDYLNARRTNLDSKQLHDLMQRVAAFVMLEEQPVPMLEYLSMFFVCKQQVARLIGKNTHVDERRLNLRGSWLSWDSVRRALVIPDVRKLALEIQWEREIRPGEHELVRRQVNASHCSAFTVAQAVRTPEYLMAVRTGIMYGTLEDLAKNGWLDSVILALIHTRMDNRAGLDWLKRCVVHEHAMHRRPASDVYMIVLGEAIAVVNNRQASLFRHSTTAFHAWCEVTPSTIDGRYDVSNSTI
tara:strand:- start:147 stop:1055 length:909 start_codon:yes stop_codon:yes gene_type:complete